MLEKKDLFLNRDLRSGEFFELAICVCPSSNPLPLHDYIQHLWSLEELEGPYDNDFNLEPIEFERIGQSGLLNIEGFTIPVNNYIIKEEEEEEDPNTSSANNWFDIGFYESAIDLVAGEEFQTWKENAIPPEQIIRFFKKIAAQLYQVFPFELAHIGWEASGVYELVHLGKDLKLSKESGTMFLIGKENLRKVHPNNLEAVDIVN